MFVVSVVIKPLRSPFLLYSGCYTVVNAIALRPEMPRMVRTDIGHSVDPVLLSKHVHQAFHWSCYAEQACTENRCPGPYVYWQCPFIVGIAKLLISKVLCKGGGVYPRAGDESRRIFYMPAWCMQPFTTMFTPLQVRFALFIHISLYGRRAASCSALY